MARKRNSRRDYATPLRAVCWVVVALAVNAANSGTGGPGGQGLGLLLAGLLATALYFTRNTKPKGTRR